MPRIIAGSEIFATPPTHQPVNPPTYQPINPPTDHPSQPSKSNKKMSEAIYGSMMMPVPRVWDERVKRMSAVVFDTDQCGELSRHRQNALQCLPSRPVSYAFTPRSHLLATRLSPTSPQHHPDGPTSLTQSASGGRARPRVSRMSRSVSMSL